MCVYRMAHSQHDWNPGHSEEVMWQARPGLLGILNILQKIWCLPGDGQSLSDISTGVKNDGGMDLESIPKRYMDANKAGVIGRSLAIVGARQSSPNLSWGQYEWLRRMNVGNRDVGGEKQRMTSLFPDHRTAQTSGVTKTRIVGMIFG